jgi:hypothetical protein
MRINKVLIILLASFSSNFALSQTTPNFRPFTRNLELAKANESSVKDLLDTTVKRFLLIANDTSSDVHKSIQSEFDLAKSTDRLQSFTYPEKLKKNHLIIQFLNWSHENATKGEDSVWRLESLDAIIFIPLMYEDPHGESVLSLCFRTDLSIVDESKIEGGENKKPTTTLRIKKMDFFDEKSLKN